LELVFLLEPGISLQILLMQPCCAAPIAARDGQTLSRGGLVGYVGSTGHSTGPHLHFETRYGGSPRNPRLCLG